MNLYRLDSYQLLLRAKDLYKATLLQSLVFGLLASVCWFIPQVYFLKNQKFTPSFLILLTLSWFGSFLFWGVTIVYQYGKLHNFNYSFSQAIILGLKRIFPALTTLILYLLIVISGTVLLIIPGFILAFTLMFSFFLVITNKATIFGALSESHRLVWRSFSSVMLVLSNPLLIYSALSLFIYLLVLKFTTIDQFYLFSIVTQTLVQILCLPYLFAVSLCLIQNLERRK